MLPTLIALSVTVQSVIDGDTFKAKLPSGEVSTVRLSCIDSPEKKAPSGQDAAIALRSLLPTGKMIQVEPTGTDIYARTVAKVTVDNVFVNLWLVQDGHALIYKNYFRPCLEQKQEFESAQKLAQKLRLGFFSLPPEQQISPWI